MATTNIANSSSVDDSFHRNRLIDTLRNFRRSNNLTDISLKFKSTKINAHQLILSAASDVFKAMFQTEMQERLRGEVDLTGLDINDSSIINDFIGYIYSGRLDLNEENVKGLLVCASYFMMSHLKDICSQYLECLLSPENCIGIFSIASRYECTKLKEKCIKIIQERFVQVVETDEFLELPYPFVVTVLSQDYIEVPCEDTVFFAFIRWLQYDWENRCQFFNGIFQCVRLPFISNDCFELLKSKLYIDLLRSNTNKFIVINENGSLSIDENFLPRLCLDTLSVIVTTGGYDGNNCLISSFAFSPNENKWSHLAPMLTSRHDHGTASLGNNIIVAGGFNSRRGPLNSVEHYNSQQNKWRKISSMSCKRKSLGICVYRGKLFVSGGLDENYNALDTVEVYGESEDKWITYPSMNQPRYNHGFVADDKHGIFSIGGWKTKTVEQFIDGQWSMIEPMSSPRAGATSVIHSDKIYVFGGYSESQCISTIEIYEINKQKWHTGTSASISRWRAGCAVCDNMIYIFGGRDSNWQYLDTVEVYDVEKEEWSSEMTLPCKLMGLRCSVVNIPKHTIKHGVL